MGLMSTNTCISAEDVNSKIYRTQEIMQKYGISEEDSVILTDLILDSFILSAARLEQAKGKPYPIRIGWNLYWAGKDKETK